MYDSTYTGMFKVVKFLGMESKNDYEGLEKGAKLFNGCRVSTSEQ